MSFRDYLKEAEEEIAEMTESSDALLKSVRDAMSGSTQQFTDYRGNTVQGATMKDIKAMIKRNGMKLPRGASSPVQLQMLLMRAGIDLESVNDAKRNGRTLKDKVWTLKSHDVEG